MFSPGSGFTPRGSRMNSTPMNSPGLSQGFYTPRNSSQGAYSPISSTRCMYSPSNSSQGYSPINVSLSGYSPGSSSEGGYSPSTASQGPYSPRNSSPLHQQVFRHSYNKSRNSSDYNSSRQSFGSSDDYTPRAPYSRNRNQPRNSDQGYNIRDYVNPSMLEDPWAALKAENNKSMEEK